MTRNFKLHEQLSYAFLASVAGHLTRIATELAFSNSDDNIKIAGHLLGYAHNLRVVKITAE